MAKVDLTTISSDPTLSAAAVEMLEMILGYPLRASTEPEARVFPWSDFDAWHITHPMYEKPTAISVLGDNARVIVPSTVILGRNGRPEATAWWNGFKECEDCPRIICGCNKCVQLEVTAKWGFGEPDGGLEEIPGDLYLVLRAIVSEIENPDSRFLISEQTGTRSYNLSSDRSKTIEEKYDSTLSRYIARGVSRFC